MKQELVYKDESYKIVGLLFEVHNELGRYCNERQCADLLERKLLENRIPHQREMKLPKLFLGEVKGRNVVDFIIYNKIIIEAKSKRYLVKNDYYQVQRYL
jgi:GxxExxY protein